MLELKIVKTVLFQFLQLNAEWLADIGMLLFNIKYWAVEP